MRAKVKKCYIFRHSFFPKGVDSVKKTYKSIIKVSIAILLGLAFLGMARITAQAYSDESWIRPETISSGLAHACGIRGDGTLVCWGRNDHGQATPPTGTFRQVSAGRFHTCGIRSNGRLTCWGEDLHGKLSPPCGLYHQLSAGDQHTCAVTSDGNLACWGLDDDGQVSQIPTVINIYKQVTSGHYHSCALKTDGSILCWGAAGAGHDYGQAPNKRYGPYTQISAGAYHTCALKPDGTPPVCWGNNNYGQLAPPLSITYKHISAGYLHTCGIRSDGQPVCWGLNDDSQSTPVSGQYTEINAGGYFTCGLLADGTVNCWGRYNHGQSTPPSDDFGKGMLNSGWYHNLIMRSDGSLYGWGFDDDQQVSDSPAGTFIQVSAGGYHTCGIRGVGTLACWGNDNYKNVSDAPTDTFNQISAGGNFTCGIRSGGTLACWGNDYSGQISDAPIGVFLQISAGGSHSCAINSVGGLVCWGYDVDGEVSDAPTEGTFIQVSASKHHNCALTGRGELVCWGHDDYGQVSNAPTDSTFSQVSAGTKHTCAIRSDGYLTCWGFDYDGQVSDAPTGTTFNHISAGFEHNCAISSLGRIYCWGNDAYGQLVIDREPYFNSNPVIEATEDVLYIYNITAADPDAIHNSFLEIHAKSLPTWLTFSDHGEGSAVLSGTPSSDDIGVHAVELEVTDLDGFSNTQTFTIKAAFFNDPPSFVSTRVAEATEGEIYTYNFMATDPDTIHGDTLTITAPTLPDWLSLDDKGNGTGILFGTPTNEDVGDDHAVELVVTDLGGLSDKQNFTITVKNVNNPPSFTSSEVTAAIEGEVFTYNIVATDPDMIHGDTLTITALTLPDWLSLEDNGDGIAVLSGIPTNADIGEHMVDLTVSDLEGLTASQSFTINVVGKAQKIFLFLPLILR